MFTKMSNIIDTSEMHVIRDYADSGFDVDVIPEPKTATQEISTVRPWSDLPGLTRFVNLFGGGYALHVLSKMSIFQQAANELGVSCQSLLDHARSLRQGNYYVSIDLMIEHFTNPEA